MIADREFCTVKGEMVVQQSSVIIPFKHYTELAEARLISK